MGKFKDNCRGETLTTVYYSEITDTIILIYMKEDDKITIDFPITRLALSKEQATYMIVINKYQLIGAFYEN